MKFLKKLSFFKKIEKYNEAYYIRSLVQLIPYAGSSLDTLIVGRINEIREKRAREFYEELKRGNYRITPEMLESDPFFHRFIITLNAVFKERREEKIRYFARLLKNFPIEPENEELNDEYEILLDTLTDLTYREISILKKLYDYEIEYKEVEAESELKKVWLYWDKFKEEICEKFNLSESEFFAYIARLNRTGLLKEFTGTYWGYKGEEGRLTDLFYKLVNYIEAKGEDFLNDEEA